MKPERTEQILKHYGNRIPEDPLFDEETDRRMRLELQASAKEEEELRSSAHLVRGYRRRESIHRAAIAILTAVAATLLFALILPKLGSRTDSGNAGQFAKLVAEGDRSLDQGAYVEAEVVFRRALDGLLDTKRIEASDHASILRRLGDTHRAQGKTYQAELFYAEALALRLPSFPAGYLDVAAMLDYLGSQAAKRGDFETARGHFEQMSKLFGPRRRNDENRSFFEESYALASDRQVDLVRRLSEQGPSAEHYRRYVEFHESLPDDGSPRPLYLANLAEAYRSLAGLSMQAKDLAGADAYYRKALDAHESLNKLDPDNPEYLRVMSDVLRPMAEVARQRSDFVRCRGYLDRSRDLKLQLLEGNLEDRDLERSLGDVYGYRGQLAMQLGELDMARDESRKSVEIFEDLVSRMPLTDDLESLALAYAQSARIAEIQSDPPTALARHEQVAKVSRRLAAANPDNPRFRETIATTHTKIGEILATQGRSMGAIREFGKYVNIYQELASGEPRNKRYVEHLSIGYARLADLYRQEADRDMAREFAQKAVATYEQLVEDDPANPIYRDLLLRSYDLAGELTTEAEQWFEASQYFRALADLRESALGKEDPLTARARARQGAALVTDENATRTRLIEAETLLRDASRILHAAGNTDWERESLKALLRLYEPDRLDYPRKLADIQRRLH